MRDGDFLANLWSGGGYEGDVVAEKIGAVAVRRAARQEAAYVRPPTPELPPTLQDLNEFELVVRAARRWRWPEALEHGSSKTWQEKESTAPSKRSQFYSDE